MLDNNFGQKFDLNDELKNLEIQSVKLTFESAYDTFGRIIVYQLKFNKSDSTDTTS